MKTIYITEAQKKKIKKAIAAQDQVGGKVNAGVMDAVAYGGMCENIENETKWNGEGEEFNLEKANNIPSVLYHASLKKNRESILTNGIVAGVGEEYSGWWNYDGPNGETPDDEELPDAVFLSYNPNTWSNTYPNDFMDIYKIDTKKLNKNLFYLDPDKYLALKGCFCYMGDIPKEAFKLVDCTYMGKSYSISENLAVHENQGDSNAEKDTYELGAEKGMSPYYHVTEGIGPNRMVDVQQLIRSDKFKAWFGDWENNPQNASKAVDKNGIPLIVHHGSPKFIGDRFNKEKIGNSINHGEGDIFCTTQDMSWAKRFSYPATQGTFSFTIKPDYSKPGDILSGFLNLRHPLDFFHLTDEDWKNIKSMIKDTYFGDLADREGYMENQKEVIEKYVNHQLVKGNIAGAIKLQFGTFGKQLKRYGYDGLIADMGGKDGAVEYCFLEPNQFKSIYALSFDALKDSIYEDKKKAVKNDKGEIVPETCDKCGGKVVLQIHGEPVYVCKNCGKYFGTMPFTLKENKLNESNEEIITLYHGVNRKGLEFNLENGGFIPRVCSEGGPKAVWLSEKQYNYEFTFAFDFPKSLVEQLSNVDYIFTNKIGFNDFNCRLVKTSISSYLDDIVVETNILNDKLSKLHFRYFPDLGITLWKEFKQYPNVLEMYINPFIEKYQKLQENVESEVVNPEDVDLSSFNIKKNLNPKFWKNGILDSRIRLKLLDIADDFIEFLGIDWAKPEDITMTGSLANFNWDEKYSDIDLHIIMDYYDVDERTDFVSNYFYSQKKLWNEEHSDITIMGFPVEVFVQDVNERHDSSGVYSLEKNKWLIEPEREKLASSKVNKAFIKDKVSEYMNKIDKLEYLLNKSKDDEYRLRRVMEKSDKLFDKIKGERKIGFERSGGKEINNYNIVFKALRRNGYIEKLVNVKSMAYDKLNSLR